MNPFLVTKRFSRPLIPVLAALALALAWAGASSAVAEESLVRPVVPDFEALLLSEADCSVPSSAAAELPELFPAPQPKTGNCSPLCGYVPCRGMLVGEACTKATGAAGTCYGPPMGKQCADGLPMCLCV